MLGGRSHGVALVGVVVTEGRLSAVQGLYLHAVQVYTCMQYRTVGVLACSTDVYFHVVQVCTCMQYSTVGAYLHVVKGIICMQSA